MLADKIITNNRFTHFTIKLAATVWIRQTNLVENTNKTSWKKRTAFYYKIKQRQKKSCAPAVARASDKAFMIL
jgi:hypothetical protein